MQKMIFLVVVAGDNQNSKGKIRWIPSACMQYASGKEEDACSCAKACWICTWTKKQRKKITAQCCATWAEPVGLCHAWKLELGLVSQIALLPFGWQPALGESLFVSLAKLRLIHLFFFKKPLGYRPFRRDSSIIIFANSSELLGLTVVVNPFVQSPSCRLCGLDLWRFVWLTSLRCCTRVQGCCEDWSSCYFRVIIRRHCKNRPPCIITVSTINVYNFMCRIVLVTWDSEIYRNRLNYWACPNCTIPKHVTP